jgi:hypothetical protein
MKAAEDGRRYDAAHVLDGAMDRSVLVERPMSPQLGDAVRILKGPFAHHVGLYHGMKPHERIEVLFCYWEAPSGSRCRDVEAAS